MTELYKKYRPQSLSEFFGNENSVTSLKSLLKDKSKFPTAVLFHGPSGCGKTTLARILKSELGCSDTDFTELNTANTRGIDTIREVIQYASFTTFSGGVKVYLIDECFPGNTKVLVDYDKAVRISDIVRNSNIAEVLSYDLKNKRIIKRKIIRRIKRRFSGSRVKISVGVDSDIFSISTTDSHKFYVFGKGYVLAKELKVGDKLVKLKGNIQFKYSDAKRVYKEPDLVRAELEAFARNSYAIVTKVKILEYSGLNYREGWVYNLEVEGTHNYFACAQGMKVVPNKVVCKGYTNEKGTQVNSYASRVDTQNLLSFSKKSRHGHLLPILVSNCHKLTNDAQNALLKSLEDTPPKVYFVLCTTEPSKLIATIRNRCTMFQVSRLSSLVVLGLLERVCKLESKEVSKDVLREISRVCDGSPREALKILDQVIDLESKKALQVVAEAVIGESKVIDICKLLAKPKTFDRWVEMAKLYKNLEDADPEQVRVAITNYLVTVLLNNGEERTANMIQFFAEPFINSQKGGLVLALWKASKL